MQLTRFTDYSLRLLMLLGLKEAGEISTIQSVSDAYGISRNHLVKIVNQLTELKIIETNRGRKGGIRLVMDPRKVVVGKLIRKLEPTLRVVECFDEDTDNCVISAVCMLKPALHEALDEFFRVLDGYTLADLIESRRQLAQPLGVDVPPGAMREHASEMLVSIGG